MVPTELVNVLETLDVCGLGPGQYYLKQHSTTESKEMIIFKLIFLCIVFRLFGWLVVVVFGIENRL